MNLKVILKIVSCSLLILFLITVQDVTAQTVMYIDPPRMPQKAVGEQCTLKVRVRNAAGIYLWQASLYFNPNVLQGVSVAEDSFLKYAHGVSHSTFFVTQSPIFDNINGILKPIGCTQFGEDSGGVGDGPLVKVIFQVSDKGNSIIDIPNSVNDMETYLCDNDMVEIPFLCQDGFYGNENIPPSPSFQISTGIEHQIRPAVAWNNTDNEFLVTWEEYSTTTGNSNIKGQRISPSGNLLGLPISIEGGLFFYTFSPSVSWNGTNYLVAYAARHIAFPQGDYDIRARTVSPSGSVSSEFYICNDIRYEGFPAIAWNGSNHLVVWEDHRDAWEDPDINSQLVDASGNLVGSNFTITATSNKEVTPHIASDGFNYLVVWMNATASDPYGPIYGQQVDASGNLINSSFQITAEGAIPNIAFDGTNYLVVYQKLNGSIEWDIYAQRVSSDGSLVGSEFAINTATGDQTMPKVIYEPSSGKYLVIWVSEQSMPAVYAQRVNTDGTLFGAPFLLGNASYHQIYPSIVYGSANELIAWADLRGGTDFDIYGYNPEPLGIELSSFSAQVSNDGIVLAWRIESESSIAQYFIKRRESKDEYKELARIPGSGSSPSPKSYSYRDGDVKLGTRYYYKLGAVKTDGSMKWYGPVSAMVTVAKSFFSISPNPFTTKTVIEFTSSGVLEFNSQFSNSPTPQLYIYDVTGRLVKSFSLFSPHSSLITTISWDGTNDSGRRVPPGVYFVRLSIDNYNKVRKVMLLR
jgi:hypothetical protein